MEMNGVDSAVVTKLETTMNGVDEVEEYQRIKGRRTSLTPGQ